MLNKFLLAVAVATVAVTALLAVNLYRAGQELSRALDVPRSTAPAASTAPSLESADSFDRAPTAIIQPRSDHLPDSDWSDVTERVDPEAADEHPDPLTSIQALLNDPDPEVRSEAAALLQVWQGESTPPSADLPLSDP